MISIEDAIAFAAKAHEGQLDKAGEPYIYHVLRVMHGVKTPEEKMTAILHDVIEDTPYTLDDLRNIGVPENVLVAIDYLTHKAEDEYFAYVAKTAQNEIALVVKLADLHDNISFDVAKIKNPVEEDFHRGEKYGRALDILRKLKF